MQLVLNSYGLQISQRNRCFQIESKTGNRIISPARITSILVTKAINISSSAILLAVENNIPIILVDSIGQPVVKISPVLASGHTSLRKQQYDFSKSPASVQWVIRMLLLKTEGQISNMAWWANRKSSLNEICKKNMDRLIVSQKKLQVILNEQSSRSQVLQSLRGWEGSNARCYWESFAQFAQLEDWNMQGRSYRPALDQVNAALNYLYGMLYHQVETALACTGLDSQVGIWHRDEYQTPSLSFDIIEPLRPKIDRMLTDMLMQKSIEPGCFETNEKYGHILNKNGKMIIIPAFNAWLEERVKLNNQVTEMKNHILQQAYDIREEIEKIVVHEE